MKKQTLLLACLIIASQTITPRDYDDNYDDDRSYREGYVENVGERTGDVIKDTGLLAGGLLGFGRDRDEDGTYDNRRNRNKKYKNDNSDNQRSGNRRQQRRQNRRNPNRSQN